MDNTEVHYITYDPEEIWDELTTNYVLAGGDILYPGDEKEMLLRSVQANIVQAYAAVDNALRMQTLRYAVGDYLDLYGEMRMCERIQASPATATVTITTNATGEEDTLPAGTAISADGEVFYLLDEDFTLTGYVQSVTVPVTAAEAGEAGNALTSGTAMFLANPNGAVNSIVAASNATGGNNREDDETYRERIYTYGLQAVTTGPSRQYEAAAKAASSLVLDAKAVNTDDGEVTVYLIAADGQSTSTYAAIIDTVEAALSAEDTRPLTDSVEVAYATSVSYTLNVEYQIDGTISIASAVAAAVAEYVEWQDNHVGQAFNPDMLAAAIYQAGATRVTWGSGSNFNGGAVQYTPIADSERCDGTISVTEVTS